MGIKNCRTIKEALARCIIFIVDEYVFLLMKQYHLTFFVQSAPSPDKDPIARVIFHEVILC